MVFRLWFTILFQCISQPAANEGVILPECEKLSKTVMSLPMHPYLTDDELKTICDIVKSAY